MFVKLPLFRRVISYNSKIRISVKPSLEYRVKFCFALNISRIGIAIVGITVGLSVLFPGSVLWGDSPTTQPVVVVVPTSAPSPQDAYPRIKPNA